MSGPDNLQKVCIFYRHLARLFFVLLNNVFLIIYYFVNLQTALISRLLQNKPIRERVRISSKIKIEAGSHSEVVILKTCLLGAGSWMGWKDKRIMVGNKIVNQDLWKKINEISYNKYTIKVICLWFQAISCSQLDFNVFCYHTWSNMSNI